MKIAVATMDGIAVSPHFGQSKGFVVFKIEGKEVRSREFLTNHHTPHAQGLCKHEGTGQHDTDSHANILELLSDCNVVLCGGMGVRAAQALKSRGIEPLMVASNRSADEIVSDYLNGTLASTDSALCNCHH